MKETPGMIPRGPRTVRAVGKLVVLCALIAGALLGIIARENNPLLNVLVFVALAGIVGLMASYFSLREAIRDDAAETESRQGSGPPPEYCDDPNCRSCQARRALASAGFEIPPGARIGLIVRDDFDGDERSGGGLVH